MAALASLLRRRRRLTGVLLRTLSTTTATSNHTTLSSSSGKVRLRREDDPDRSVSLLDAIDTTSLSVSSLRHALSLAARHLSRSGRKADAEALLSSHIPASPTEPHLAAVLCAYASASLPNEALSAFRSAAPSLPTPISPLPFNALLSGFLRCHQQRRVPVLFAELSKEFSIIPNAVSYGILVKAYVMTRNDAQAYKVLDQMREQGISPTTNIYTSLIDSMYKQKKPEEAETLWKEMLESGCKPDQVTYNVKVLNYALNGKPEDVLELMAEMEAAGLKPDTFTYNFLMTSYCKHGKVEDAKGIYKSLVEKGGCPANGATYREMLAALCAHGDFDAGLEVFSESLRRRKVPDSRTMKFFVKGLANGGRVAEAKEVVAKVKKMFPENMVSGWKELEKELGLSSDDGNLPSQEELTAEQALAEARTALAPELEESTAEENAVLEGSANGEKPMPESSSDEEVPRAPA